ncbi:MAG: polysaccharide biosynthesis/export family protein [Bacteroidota bacterium]|nr:polysaccharide biosynthesis/export family protein [Bacteroidota bacterium]
MLKFFINFPPTFRNSDDSVRRSVVSAIYFQFISFLILLVVFLSSCTTTKNTTYFQNLQKDTTLNNLVSKDFESTIQKGDLLGITVASLSPENTLIYNAPQNTVGTLAGHLVDENGNIQFIKLGSIHAAGMTRKELKTKLQNDLSPYLKETVVSVGFMNRHVTMMGGISPQVLPMITDNMTILDALAASGDVATKGRSDNILVIREKDNSKIFKRLNLTDQSVFYSPYFYLQPNDIIYVQPIKIKVDNANRIFSYVTFGISIVTLILGRFIK